MKKTMLILIMALLAPIAVQAADVTWADKSTGGTFTAANANEVKAAVNSKQDADPDLDTYAGITPSTDVQSLLGAANYSAMRTGLSLVPGTDVQAYDALLADIAALTDPNADRIAFWDDSAGAIVWLTVGTNLSITDTTLSASLSGGSVDISGTPVANDFARFIDGDTIEGRSYAEVRADLNLEPGTDILAYDADTAKLDVVNTWTAAQTFDEPVTAPSFATSAANGAWWGGWGGNNTGTEDIPTGLWGMGYDNGALSMVQNGSKVGLIDASNYILAARVPILNQNTTGNAATATALAANGGNCSAGSYPLGIDASGVAEGCTDATTEIDSAIATHAGEADPHPGYRLESANILIEDVENDLKTHVITAIFNDVSSTVTSAKLRVPTGAAWQAAHIMCETVDASLEFDVDIYDSISDATATTLSAAELDLDASQIYGDSIDITGWTDPGAGAWVTVEVATVSAAADECTVQLVLYGN